jgi:hypothetical protein
LGEEGFVEGFQQVFEAPHALAVSLALVFGSRSGAAREERAKVRETLAELGKGVRRLRSGVPGMTLVEQPRLRSGPARGTRFLDASSATGRCTLSVAIGVRHAVSAARARASVLSGASAVLRRAEAPCAGE